MKVLKVILKISLFVVGFGAYTFLTMLLWNHLIPSIFSLPQISFWQTLGLIVLIKMLFLGNGWGKNCPPNDKKRMAMKKRKAMWKKKFQRKMENKTQNDIGFDSPMD